MKSRLRTVRGRTMCGMNKTSISLGIPSGSGEKQSSKDVEASNRARNRASNRASNRVSQRNANKREHETEERSRLCSICM